MRLILPVNIAIQLLLDWIDQIEYSTKIGSNKIIDKHYSKLRLLTAPEVAISHKVSRAGAYQLIQHNKLQSIRND